MMNRVPKDRRQKLNRFENLMDEDDEDEEDPPVLVESSDEGEDDEEIPSAEELKSMKREWEEVRRPRNQR
eukprot:5735200-Karenia_brevis.AAC.1